MASVSTSDGADFLPPWLGNEKLQRSAEMVTETLISSIWASGTALFSLSTYKSIFRRRQD